MMVMVSDMKFDVDGKIFTATLIDENGDDNDEGEEEKTGEGEGEVNVEEGEENNGEGEEGEKGDSLADKIKNGASTVDGVMDKIEGMTDNETVNKITDGVQNIAGKVGDNADKIAKGINAVKDSGVLDKIKSFSPWKKDSKHKFKLFRFTKINKSKKIS